MRKLHLIWCSRTKVMAKMIGENNRFQLTSCSVHFYNFSWCQSIARVGESIEKTLCQGFSPNLRGNNRLILGVNRLTLVLFSFFAKTSRASID